jgi:translation initiation factor 4B
MSDAGSERGSRRPFEQAQGDGKIRDFSNWERKGPLSPSTTAAPSLRDGGRQNSRGITGDPALRRNSPAWGEGTGRSQDGSRPPRRDFSEKPAVERAPTAAELDNKWRANMRPDPPAKSPTPETSAPGSPAPAPAAPTTRPKLNLTKRTVSEADPTSPAPSTDSKASPFGAARPVDTLAREKEIEEKRQLAIRQKKEADEKAREEKAEQKRLVKEKADAAKAKAAETQGETETEKAVWASQPTENENGIESTEKPAAPKFEVLRRVTSGDNDMVAEEDEEEAAPITVVEDKAVKPKEIVRDTRPPKTNGAWRNNKKEAAPKAAAPAPNSTTASMEEDGWSTVTSTKKPSNRRGGGNAPTRAIAS